MVPANVVAVIAVYVIISVPIRIAPDVGYPDVEATGIGVVETLVIPEVRVVVCHQV